MHAAALLASSSGLILKCCLAFSMALFYDLKQYRTIYVINKSLSMLVFGVFKCNKYIRRQRQQQQKLVRTELGAVPQVDLLSCPLLPDNTLPSSRYQSAILNQMAVLAASWQHNTGFYMELQGHCTLQLLLPKPCIGSPVKHDQSGALALALRAQTDI